MITIMISTGPEVGGTCLLNIKTCSDPIWWNYDINLQEKSLQPWDWKQKSNNPKKGQMKGEKYTKTVNKKGWQKIQTWSTWHDILIFNILDYNHVSNLPGYKFANSKIGKEVTLYYKLTKFVQFFQKVLNLSEVLFFRAIDFSISNFLCK